MTAPKRSRLVPEVDFDRDGVQRGFVRLFHSTHASAYGFIPIPIVVIRNGDGPTALFVSGNHGDEYEGQVALSELARELRAEDIRGRVIILPMANYPAAMAGRRVSPIDDANLNRIFPGDPDGTVSQQIAWFITEQLIPRADLVCDLHSGGSSLMYSPCALMTKFADEKRTETLRQALIAFGAPLAYIAEPAQGQGADQTLGGVAARQGVLALGTELGGAGTVTPAAVQMARRGVRNLLVHLGILPESARLAPPSPTRLLGVAPDAFLYAPENGVFEPLAAPGDMVEAGQPAGRIHFPESPGLAPVAFAFPGGGYVLCRRVPARTMRGDCLFGLGVDLG
ncbi:MAG: succinylglutamate desuccinylase/aspartoacylase family protein [Proteobacteria bacterium]|nr:succinylglutamate desuccinylase/aspartoacylase family protein [Pseudomonadota bacterium]